MKTQPDDSSQKLYATRRLEALTDGVFAIAMTLLVLDITVSEFGHQVTSAGLWHAFASARQAFTSFVISFLILGSMWGVHMRQFEYIKLADRRLVSMNNVRLLIVVIMPLTTSIAGSYQDLVLGRILLPINFFLLAIISYREWRYATKDERKVHGELGEPERYRAELRSRAIIWLSLLIIPLSVWIGDWAFLLLLFIPAVTKLLGREVGDSETS